MEIIDAFWEKKNLGISTKEIIIQKEDKLEQVKLELEQISCKYIVIKVPIKKIDIMFFLEENGFHFIETNIHMTHNLKNIQIDERIKRILDKVSYKKMDYKDINSLYKEIENGLFCTDRVYLDNYFTKEQASNRYINWIENEYKNNAEIFKLLYGENNIGFFTLKSLDQKIYYPFLAGIYQKYQNTALGLTFNYKIIEEIIKRNGKMISIYVSTNTPNAIRIHTTCGFQIDDINYTYIKHL